MSGIIGKKVGMTTYFNREDGKTIPCTVIEAGPCVVTQLKTDEKDGYSAIQISYNDKKEKRTSAPLKGHFKKAGTTAKSKVVEFKAFELIDQEVELGKEIKIENVFNEGDFVDVASNSKGKGFQGVVKRHGFGGVGQGTHGQHNRMRAPGSIGGASYPARVFPGLRMAGRMGGKRVKVLNLRVVQIFKEKNLLLVSGSVPGPKNGFVIIEK